jgi:hypothetical protein
VLGRSSGLAAHDELRGLSRDANEANLTMARLARYDLESAWEYLYRIIGGATEADRLRRRQLVKCLGRER